MYNWTLSHTSSPEEKRPRKEQEYRKPRHIAGIYSQSIEEVAPLGLAAYYTTYAFTLDNLNCLFIMNQPLVVTYTR